MNEHQELNYILTSLLQEYDKAILSETIKDNFLYQRELEREIKEVREKISLLLNNK